MPGYFNPKHFAIGQRVRYAGFPATIVRHYFEGMWEIRTPGGVACVSGSHIEA